MNRLAMIAATCILGLVLSACGDNGTTKPAVPKTGAPAGQAQHQDKTGTTQGH